MNLPKSSGKQTPALVLAALSAFCVYTCMFAFRKPFTVATYEGLSFGGVGFKIWLVIAQTLGYSLAKFWGIRAIGGLDPAKRMRNILFCIFTAWIALLFFALVPPPYNIIFLLLNGFPLGMVYGLVFSYLEGRRSTELLGAVLAASFIFASGFAQSAGKWVADNLNVSQWWMPFATGAVFLLPTALFAWLLQRTPPPTAADEAARTKRKPMTGAERKAFVREFLPGLVLLTLSYVLLTIIREYRSNFAANIWTELGQGKDTSIFTRTEVPASLFTLFVLGMLMWIRGNFTALLVNHYIVIAGFAICGGSTLLYTNGHLDPFWWMTLLGVGMYMGYVPFNSMLFDRLIAAFRHAGNAGFLIYLADSFGYLGSDAILIVKNFGGTTLSWTQFFITLVEVLSAMGILLMLLVILYWRRKRLGTRANS